MGATNCPETPRQRMIGMMYLVLTAMLALNVSKEIINAFVTVGEAMQQTNINISNKTSDSYSMFDQAYKNNPEKVEVNYEKAKKVRELSQGLLDFIDATKFELVAKVEKLETPEQARELLDTKGINGMKAKDDYSIGSRYFCGSQEDAVGAKGTELKDHIENYKKELQNILGEDADKINLGLETDGEYYDLDNKTKRLTWERYNFYNTIAVADVVILNRIKAEVLNAEFDVVSHLYRAVNAGDFKFSEVTAKIIPNSKYVLKGNYFEAAAIVAAYDSKTSMDAVVNGNRLTSTNGVIPIKLHAGALGKQSVKGTLFVKTEGGVEEYDFTEEYFVIPPTAVVELTKMDVLYVGVDNPVSISVPMVDAKDISVSFAEASGAGWTKGTIAPDPETKGAGNYVIKVSSQGRTKLNIYSKMDGKTQFVGEKIYRCKTIPQPVIEIGKSRGGSISKEELIAAGRIRVIIPDFDFKIPPIKVTQFLMDGTDARGQYMDFATSGDRFDQNTINFIQKARKGQRINISDVRVTTPDGRQHTLSASFVIK